MKGILFWFWEFPQNLVGFIISRFANKLDSDDEMSVYIANNFFNSAVSLGEYRIADKIYKNHAVSFRKMKQHEYGHTLQSRRFGWLYFIIVGLPSLVRNIYDRIAHKNWTNEERTKWYYGSWPENNADKLGGVRR